MMKKWTKSFKWQASVILNAATTGHNEEHVWFSCPNALSAERAAHELLLSLAFQSLGSKPLEVSFMSSNGVQAPRYCVRHNVKPEQTENQQVNKQFIIDELQWPEN